MLKKIQQGVLPDTRSHPPHSNGHVCFVLALSCRVSARTGHARSSPGCVESSLAGWHGAGPPVCPCGCLSVSNGGTHSVSTNTLHVDAVCLQGGSSVCCTSACVDLSSQNLEGWGTSLNVMLSRVCAGFWGLAGGERVRDEDVNTQNVLYDL